VPQCDFQIDQMPRCFGVLLESAAGYSQSLGCRLCGKGWAGGKEEGREVGRCSRAPARQPIVTVCGLCRLAGDQCVSVPAVFMLAWDVVYCSPPATLYQCGLCVAAAACIFASNWVASLLWALLGRVLYALHCVWLFAGLHIADTSMYGFVARGIWGGGSRHLEKADRSLESKGVVCGRPCAGGGSLQFLHPFTAGV
jgi:hypothetical protein